MLLRRLACAVRRCAAHDDGLAALDPLGDGVTVGVGLPVAERGQPRLGRVALGLAVPHEVDLVGDAGTGRSGCTDLLVAVVLAQRLLHAEPGTFPQRRQGLDDRLLRPAVAEPAQVERHRLVGFLVDVGGVAGAPLEVLGEIQRRLVPVGPRKMRPAVSSVMRPPAEMADAGEMPGCATLRSRSERSDQSDVEERVQRAIS